MASVDKGQASFIGHATSQVTTEPNPHGQPDQNNGSYIKESAAGWPTRDLSPVDFIGVGPDALPVPVTGGTVHTYKMQGWYAAGAVFETWTSTSAPNTTPPSGHTLSNISYIVLS